MVRPGAARTQALEVTEENPLGLTVDAIPDDVNSLNGFNEVCCVCSPLILSFRALCFFLAGAIQSQWDPLQLQTLISLSAT